MIFECVAAGFLSWCYLHRYTVRGDRAALFFISSFLLFHGIQSYRDVQSSSSLLFSLRCGFIYLFSLTSATLAYRLSPWHPLSAYPGPIPWRTTGLVLTIVSLRGKRHLDIDSLHRRYGVFVRIGPNALSINSFAANNVIYASTHHHMNKSDSYLRPGHVAGVSLFFKQDRKDHSRRKRIWTEAFTSTAIHEFLGPLEQRSLQLTQCILKHRDKDGATNMIQCIDDWSYDFMGDMVFGGSNDLELMRDGDVDDLVHCGKLVTVIIDSIGQAPWLMDILWHIPAGQSMHKLRHVAAQMMRRRVNAKGSVAMRDIASYLIEGDPHSGAKISMPDLELDALIAIQAGSDNTAAILILCLYYLLSEHQRYISVQSILDQSFPRGPATITLDDDVLSSIPILDAITLETLRLGTPFFLPRVVPEEGVEIEGNFIPGGTIVAVAAYSQQISEANFHPNPQDFIPERWLQSNHGESTGIRRSALGSFSFGPYACVAKRFAMQEVRHVLARLILTFDMEFVPDFDPESFINGFRNMRTSIFNTPLRIVAVPRNH